MRPALRLLPLPLCIALSLNAQADDMPPNWGLCPVGDVVKLGDKAGVVEALSIRTVRLRDLSGTVHIIPFSAIEGDRKSVV